MYAVRDSRPLVDGAVSGGHAYSLDDGSAHSRGLGSKSSNPAVLMVANIAAPYVRAAVGMMTKGRKNFEAYSTDRQFGVEADVMGDTMQWATTVSRFDAKMALCVDDAMTRGVGATVSYLDFTHEQYAGGLPVVQKKHHVFFDRGGRDDLSSSNMGWCGYADPIYRDDLDDYIESKGGYKSKDAGGVSFREQFLQYSQTEDEQYVDFLYHYFWREWTTVYDLENPFVTRKEELAQASGQNAAAWNLLGAFAKKHHIDLERSKVITLDKAAHKDFRDMVDNFEYLTGLRIEGLKSNSRRARCYYRAQIADGRILEKSLSYTRDCHPMNIMTAYYDRQSGSYYGLMRSAAYIQEELNKGVSNLSTYADRSATGGNIALTNVGTEMKDVIQNIMKKEQAFPMPDGAGVVPLQSGDASASMTGIVNLMVELMPMVLGVPKEILGMMNNDTPAASLFRQAIQQMQISLSHVMNNIADYVYDQGCIFRDMTFEMAQNADMMVLQKISPAYGEEPNILLSMDNLARNYAIHIVEQDKSDDDRQDEFMRMVEYAQMLPEAQRIAILPELLELSSFDAEVKQKITERADAAMQPPPPNPEAQAMEREMQTANIRLMNAQAAQLEGEAAVSQQIAPTRIESSLSEIRKRDAETERTKAEVSETRADTQRSLALATKAEAETAVKLAGV